jgi:hypothetical protein
MASGLSGSPGFSPQLTRLATLALLLCASPAAADDRITVGYLLSRPSAASGGSSAHAVASRWDRMFTPYLEAGAGLEIGFSFGDQALQRYAFLPGAAFVYPVGEIVVRVEEQLGWQIVRGRLTLDGIPLAGTETRSFHNAFAVAADAGLTDTFDIRARLGFAIDGIYPAGHASTFFGLFAGIAIVVHPR